MTVNEIVNKTWVDCGEPSDMDPAGADGLAFLIQSLNISMDCVVQWKGFQGRRRTHFPDYITSGYAKNNIDTATVTYDSMITDILDITGAPSTFTPVAGDVVVYEGESRLVYYADTTELWLSSAFTNREDDASEADITITVHQAVMTPDFSRFVEYLRVSNVAEASTLPRMKKNQETIGEATVVGNPRSWTRKGVGIIFDVPPEEVVLWKISYYRLPTLAVEADYAAGETFDIPEEFHVAVLAYMKALLYSQMQETDFSTNQYRTFQTLMSAIQGSWEQKNLLEQTKHLGVRTA